MTLLTMIRGRWYRKSGRRVGPALAAVGAAATAGVGMLLLATPGAVLADIPAGATIQVVVPTNGKCELEDVVTHTQPTDEIVYEAPNFVITRVPDQTIPTDAKVQFGMSVDTRGSGCAMKKPVTVKVDGKPINEFENEISRWGTSMTVSFHPPVSKPTKTATTKPTKTPTAKPTETPTAKPTQSPTMKPTESPTPKPTETTPPALPTTGGRLGPLVAGGLGILVVGALLTAAASAHRLRRSSAGK